MCAPVPHLCVQYLIDAVVCADVDGPFDAIFTVGDTIQFKDVYNCPEPDVKNHVHHFPGGAWAQLKLPWGKQYGQLWMKPSFPILSLVEHYKFFGCPAEASMLSLHEPAEVPVE